MKTEEEQTTSGFSNWLKSISMFNFWLKMCKSAWGSSIFEAPLAPCLENNKIKKLHL